MARIEIALARLRHLPMEQFDLTGLVNQLCRQIGHSWRERIFTPVVTLRLFLIQILHRNTAITHLPHLSGMPFAASSYEEARARLPLQLLQELLGWFVGAAQAAYVAHPKPRLGNRVLIADGSSFSMSDTPQLRKHFGLPKGQKPGVGYPTAKLMGLLDVASGMFIRLLALPLYTMDPRSTVAMHDCLQLGDILLGDRALCSYAHFCLLSQRGVFGCFRLHHHRKTDRLGRVHWKKPKVAPAWMGVAQFAAMPAFLEVRLVRYVTNEPGFRSKVLFLATSLLDEQIWSDQQLAELYGRRWHIETCFNHLKTTMNMNILKCQTLDGVCKELAMYMLVYNMVWLLLALMAARQGRSVWRISFVDVYRYLAVRMLGLPGILRILVNPHRPGRVEPRMVRRRPKKYPRMQYPRADLKNQLRNRQVDVH
jgi:hypothetical protein